MSTRNPDPARNAPDVPSIDAVLDGLRGRLARIDSLYQWARDRRLNLNTVKMVLDRQGNPTVATLRRIEAALGQAEAVGTGDEGRTAEEQSHG